MQNFVYTAELPSARNVKRIYSNMPAVFIYSILMHYAYENLSFGNSSSKREELCTTAAQLNMMLLAAILALNLVTTLSAVSL